MEIILAIAILGGVVLALVVITTFQYFKINFIEDRLIEVEQSEYSMWCRMYDHQQAGTLPPPVSKFGKDERINE